VRLPSLVLAAGVALATALAPRAATADGLTVGETERLLRGATVVRPTEVERWGRRYVGGVSYAMVDADPDEVATLLEDVATWQRILPRTRSTRVVGYAGDDPLVLVTHGTALIQASYTIRVHREGALVRFWLDTSRRHDIEDAWGFLRVEPLDTPDGRADRGQAVVSYGILVDMGPGLLRDLFEGRVRDLALSVPERVQGLVVTHVAGGRRASR
jgi:hypothetical protein